VQLKEKNKLWEGGNFEPRNCWCTGNWRKKSVDQFGIPFRYPPFFSRHIFDL